MTLVLNEEVGPDRLPRLCGTRGPCVAALPGQVDEVDYRAVLSFDYSTPIDANALSPLYNALEQADWEYAETSAMYVEASDLGPVLMGLDLLARALHLSGNISALNLQVQRLFRFEGVGPGVSVRG